MFLVTSWAERSQQAACRNAMAAWTAPADLRPVDEVRPR